MNIKQPWLSLSCTRNTLTLNLLCPKICPPSFYSCGADILGNVILYNSRTKSRSNKMCRSALNRVPKRKKGLNFQKESPNILINSIHGLHENKLQLLHKL